MTESEFTRQALIIWRTMPECKTFKHADRYTSGIPDISVTTRGRTTWLELKSVSRDESPVARVAQDQVQLKNMYDLSQYGRAFYLIMDDGCITLWHPEYLVRRIITDKKFGWTREMYVEGFTVGDVEAIVKGGRKDPTLFDSGRNWSVLREVVEV